MSNINIENTGTVNKHILLNYFAGNSEPLQKKVIEQWLGTPDNLNFYYDCYDEWLKSNYLFIPNESEAFKKIIQEHPHKKEGTIRSFYQMIGMKMIAASIFFVVLGTSFFLTKDFIFYKTIQTAFGETKTIVLPDNSVVTLNANTLIKFPRFGFGENKRIVELNGEADFSVVHTKSNQQFIVKTANNLDVLVLGTQFCVYARGTQANVVLRKGRVSLTYSQNKVIKNAVLHPGDFFTSKNEFKEAQINHIPTPERLSAWENHEFIFDELTFADIGRILKDNFGIEAQFQNNELANTQISGTIKAYNSDELIEAIAQLLDINYKVENKTVYFFE